MGNVGLKEKAKSLLLRGTLLLQLIVASISSAYASEQIEVYGSFLWMQSDPDTLFLLGDIGKADSFAFRQALREHKVSTIVVDSSGGLITEALLISETIFDLGLQTYVPTGATCESACAFIFFSGKYRSANGKLGVHQFFSDSTADQGTSEQFTQFTVSEIIAFLNRYGVPSWVYEKMFKSPEMYYFTDAETLKLQAAPLAPANQVALEASYLQLLSLFASVSTESAQIAPPAEEAPDALPQVLFTPVKPTNPTPTDPTNPPTTSTKELQRELRRVGCYTGGIDGVLGPKTSRAMKEAASKLSLISSVSYDELLVALQDADKLCLLTPTQPSIVHAPPSLAARYELSVSCQGDIKKHWLYLTPPELTGWNLARIPETVSHSFSLENRGKGAYGLCSGLSCLWRFSGWVKPIGQNRIRVEPNNYATQYDPRPSAFTMDLLISNGGKLIQGTDRLGCIVTGQAM